MAITVNFSNQVRDWIVQNLSQGVQAQAVVAELVSHKVASELAVAMVAAVARALTHGTPLPDGKLVLDADDSVGAADTVYVPASMRLPAGHVIRAGSRGIPVLARMARPCGAVLGNVLDPAECKALIAAARPRLRPSRVVDPHTGQDVVAQHRSSEGMFFRPAENDLVARIERRIAQLIGQPAENGEGLQILRYPEGAESTPHFDFLMASNAANRESIERSGQRISTLIMYLNPVVAGGETTFPETGFAVIPIQGNAVYFEYGNEAGQTDPLSLHAGAPVLSGEKWIATKWMRNRPYVPRGMEMPAMQAPRLAVSAPT
jgi:prolyl 4-hydroxylase